MDLEAGPGGEVRRVAAGDLGRGDVLPVGRDRGAVQQRPREVEGDADVGAPIPNAYGTFTTTFTYDGSANASASLANSGSITM